MGAQVDGGEGFEQGFEVALAGGNDRGRCAPVAGVALKVDGQVVDHEVGVLKRLMEQGLAAGLTAGGAQAAVGEQQAHSGQADGDRGGLPALVTTDRFEGVAKGGVEGVEGDGFGVAGDLDGAERGVDARLTVIDSSSMTRPTARLREHRVSRGLSWSRIAGAHSGGAGQSGQGEALWKIGWTFGSFDERGMDDLQEGAGPGLGL